MRKFRLICCLLLFSIFVIACFNSALAAPPPPYYYKHDYFPLHLQNVYDIYNLDNEILIASRGEVNHVGTKELTSWTFKLDDTNYPIKELKFFTRKTGTEFTEVELSKDQNNEYTFEMDGMGVSFYLITLLDNPNQDFQLSLNKLPVITHPTHSDLKLVFHEDDEILNYDFRQHGGYFEFSFDEQVAYFKKVLDGKSIPSDSDRIPSVISLNQPSWLGESLLVEGYNKTLQAFIDSEVGGGYLYSQTDYTKIKEAKQEKQLMWLVISIAIVLLILSLLIYVLIKRRKKR
ncbi:hypothetical protein HOK09_02245 [Candidatus Woesearchaeota archaeon]|jgi:hypothetical protein|nr:hypothetical protein [Candidatus Woesearchaeota archaeon]MBT6402262.1 hypothetical protein [Candidatus Woesearchaeota archaeon]